MDRKYELHDEELAKVTGGILSSTDDGKPYHCQYCGAGFDTNVQRNAHEKECPENPANCIYVGLD